MNAGQDAMGSEEQLIAFQLAHETYGIDIAIIHEIIRMRDVTRIPRTAAEIEGVINLRGKIVPIVDLRRRLGLPLAERNGATRIIVVELLEATLGIIVDNVVGVMRIPKADIELPAELIGGAETDYVRGVGKVGDALVLLLNMQRVVRVDPVVPELSATDL